MPAVLKGALVGLIIALFILIKPVITSVWDYAVAFSDNGCALQDCFRELETTPQEVLFGILVDDIFPEFPLAFVIIIVSMLIAFFLGRASLASGNQTEVFNQADLSNEENGGENRTDVKNLNLLSRAIVLLT